MENLRKLSNTAVRRYHDDNYMPDNVMFVLTGNVGEKDFFQALDKVEESIKSRLGWQWKEEDANPNPNITIQIKVKVKVNLKIKVKV